MKIIGTTPQAIELAEDRDRFRQKMRKLKIPQPESGMASTLDEAKEVADRVGYPLMVRPSFVLGGRAMEVVHDEEMLREYVAALRAIFSAFQGEEPLDFHGDFWRFDLLPEVWNPGPIDHPEVPIYVAAVRPWMARMVGEMADGLHVHPLHSRQYLDEVIRPAVTEGASTRGRSEADVALVCPVMAAVGDSDEELEAARDRARYRIAFYGSTRTYAGVFELHGWDGTSERLHELQRRGDLPAMAATITDDMLDTYIVTATWDDLAGSLVERYRGVADRLVMYGVTESWSGERGAFERWQAVGDAVRAEAGAVATD